MIAVSVAHAPGLAALHAAAFPPPEAWGEAAMAEVMGMPGTFGFLDARGGMVLARHVAGEGEILTLAVAPETRRRGLGRALLARALEAGPAPWFLEVAAANQAARALYAAAGFVECGRRRDYFGGGRDALLLRLDS